MTPKILLITTSLASSAVISLWPANSAAQPNQPGAAPIAAEQPLQNGPMLKITMDDGTVVTQTMRGRNGRRVLLRPGRRATILLQYDGSFAGLALQVAALDGGRPSFPGNRNVVDASGKVVLQFSDAQSPGLYRVSVNCGGLVSTLQFWVPNPDGSGGDASIQVPVPASTSSR
jgi:hypothetical protein